MGEFLEDDFIPLLIGFLIGIGWTHLPESTQSAIDSGFEAFVALAAGVLLLSIGVRIIRGPSNTE
ncbi:hypothetical protein DNAM5_44 [Haloarcula californiae tailed virus 1]|uniref:Uncharacterized protein n=1 Tax=Haloarcula californiae tailed virus 1 TaxID=1273746 RepID=R4TMH3_9CAUD|nr:hypothetical protein M202_gp044 [Haloarcula californiae tailed virus 1]AGM11907.1 hypothetical protein DNAM5_44 [Haloarcula californiae tailed virus 1]